MRTILLYIVCTLTLTSPIVGQEVEENGTKYFKEYNKYIPDEYNHFDHLKRKLEILKDAKSDNLLQEYPFDLFFVIASNANEKEVNYEALSFLFKILPFFKEQYSDQNYTKTFYFPYLLIGSELDFFFNESGTQVKNLEYIACDEVRYTVTDPFTNTLYSFTAKFPKGENLKDAVILFNKHLTNLNNPHGEK